MQVEVVCALADRQTLVALDVPVGTTAEQAVTVSGMLRYFPEIAGIDIRIGVFGKAVPPDTVLRERDRVEIYRPLLADPKMARRKRVAERKVAR